MVFGKRSLIIALAGMMVLLLAVACGSPPPTAAPTAAPQPTAVPGTTPTPTAATDPFQAEWDELVAAAQAEGNLVLVLGSSPSRNYARVIDEFERQFGIATVRAAGSGSENANRVLAERNAGSFTSDISFIGRTSIVRVINAGGMLPIRDLIIRPDVLDESLWYGGRLWYNDDDQRYIMAYNASLETNVNPIFYNKDRVSQAEIDSIQSIWDIVNNPDYTFGAVDPRGEGSTTERLRFYAHPDLGPAFYEQVILNTNTTFMGDDRRGVVDGLARGQWDFAILVSGAGSVDMDNAIADGLPIGKIERTLAEGKVLSVAGTLAAFERPANPNAQKLFVNWWLSPEGQDARHRFSDDPDPSQSLREDIPPTNIPEENQRRPGEEGIFVLGTDPETLALLPQSLEFITGLLQQRGVQ
jgi:ABC-type glycerol-3-phosphate transport system substrate-binding protein